MSMKKKKKISSKPQPFLPEDIITTDILPSLPVKSLFRFRCVSKTWLDLIKTPSFIDAHLARSSMINSLSQHKILLWLQRCKGSYYLRSYSLHSLLHPPSGSDSDFGNGHSRELNFHSNQIVGSCNGLVYIVRNQKGSFIWNPSTGISKKWSASNKLSILSLDNCFGFGYDQRNDDYKMALMECNISDGPSVKHKVRIHSSRANVMRKIEDFPNGKPFPNMGKFVNGALHWTVPDATSSVPSFVPSFVIVSLDLGNETYGEIAQPNYGGVCHRQTLVVLEGCLSVFRDFVDGRADIWVMKEYGARDSWVKLYTISYPKFRNRVSYMEYLVGISVRGEILFKVDGKLMIYDTKYGTFTNKRTHDMLLPFNNAAITYVESLVSP